MCRLVQMGRHIAMNRFALTAARTSAVPPEGSPSRIRARYGKLAGTTAAENISKRGESIERKQQAYC